VKQLEAQIFKWDMEAKGPINVSLHKDLAQNVPLLERCTSAHASHFANIHHCSIEIQNWEDATIRIPSFQVL